MRERTGQQVRERLCSPAAPDMVRDGLAFLTAIAAFLFDAPVGVTWAPSTNIDDELVNLAEPAIGRNSYPPDPERQISSVVSSRGRRRRLRKTGSVTIFDVLPQTIPPFISLATPVDGAVVLAILDGDGTLHAVDQEGDVGRVPVRSMTAKSLLGGELVIAETTRNIHVTEYQNEVATDDRRAYTPCPTHPHRPFIPRMNTAQIAPWFVSRKSSEFSEMNGFFASRQPYRVVIQSVGTVSRNQLALDGATEICRENRVYGLFTDITKPLMEFLRLPSIWYAVWPPAASPFSRQQQTLAFQTGWWVGTLALRNRGDVCDLERFGSTSQLWNADKRISLAEWRRAEGSGIVTNDAL